MNLFKVLPQRISLKLQEKVPREPSLDVQLSDICIGTSAAPTYLPAHYFQNGDREFNLIDGGVAANNPSLVAIGEVTRQVMKADPNFPEITPMDLGRYLLISLGTGTQKQQPLFDAKMAAKWGVLGWLLNQGTAPLIDAFTQASSDLVVFHNEVVFEALSSTTNYLRIQVDTLTGDLASVDVATTDNLNSLVKVGESLLDGPVSQVNSDTGVVEPIPDGGTNREALKSLAIKLSEERKLRETNATSGGVEFLESRGRGGGRGVKEKQSIDVDVPTKGAGIDKNSNMNKDSTKVDSGSNSMPNANSAPIRLGPTSYAKLVTGEPSRKSVKFRTFIAPGETGLMCLYHWSLLELSVKGLLIQLKNPDVNLQKEDVGSVPVWVKFHGVPMTAFSEDGLSIIATKLCTHLMLDSYTSNMCMQSCDRSSYARPMINLRADEELKDSIVVAMPKLIGEGFNMCTIRVEYEWKPSRCSSCKVFRQILNECPKKIVSDVVKNLNNPRQATRGVPVGPNVSFKSTKQIYRPVSNKNSASTSSKKMLDEVSRQEVSNSNTFDALNLIENNDDLGTNVGNSKSAGKGSLYVAHDSSRNTPIIDKIDKLKCQILD
ncbi:patatin-like protein 1, partial [Tanacetum coccineum]